jgi:hypothetical protein
MKRLRGAAWCEGSEAEVNLHYGGQVLFRIIHGSLETARALYGYCLTSMHLYRGFHFFFSTVLHFIRI